MVAIYMCALIALFRLANLKILPVAHCKGSKTLRYWRRTLRVGQLIWYGQKNEKVHIVHHMYIYQSVCTSDHIIRNTKTAPSLLLQV